MTYWSASCEADWKGLMLLKCCCLEPEVMVTFAKTVLFDFRQRGQAKLFFTTRVKVVLLLG